MRYLLVTATAVFCVVSLVAGFSTGPPEVACTTRTPQHAVFEAQTGECPYVLVAHDWIPGKGTDMFLERKKSNNPDEPTTFKGFLVSVQHPDGTLIGSMNVSATEPENAEVGSACRGTSLSHKSSTPKTYVVFQWTAPIDLDTSIDVIVRYTVVEQFDTFYVDCSPFYLSASSEVRSGAPTTASTTTTTTQSTTTTTTETTTTTPTTTPVPTTTTRRTTTTPTTTMPTTTTTRVTTTTPTTTTPMTTTTRRTTTKPTTTTAALRRTAPRAATTTTTTTSTTTRPPTMRKQPTTKLLTTTRKTTTRKLQPHGNIKPTMRSRAGPPTNNDSPTRPSIPSKPNTRKTPSTTSTSKLFIENAENNGRAATPLHGLKHQVVSNTECSEYGNSYRVVRNTNCRRYLQIAHNTEWVMSCPGSLIFDPIQCSCNWSHLVRCVV